MGILDGILGRVGGAVRSQAEREIASGVARSAGEMLGRGHLCPQCHRALPSSGLKFCPSCGAALTLACKKCKSVFAAGTKFCSACGKKLGK